MTTILNAAGLISLFIGSVLPFATIPLRQNSEPNLAAAAVAVGPRMEIPCDFCGNHFVYDEHRHRTSGELEEWRENLEGHATTEWYPYQCDIEHAECDPSEDLVWEFAEQLDKVAAVANPKASDFKAVIQEATERGLKIIRAPVGITLLTTCAQTQRPVAVTVPLESGVLAAAVGLVP
jgi:hypothetical protein